MKVGFVGLGKLGLPVATAMASRGLEVYGYDPRVSDFPQDLSYEDGFAETVKEAEDRLHFTDLETVLRNCSVVFVAVQTPHQPEYEGITPIPETRADFDYTHLRAAATAIRNGCDRLHVTPTIAVISTVLPGTMRREIDPILGRIPLVYNPSFIAMGTTIRDFLDPEFVLIGGDQETLVGSVYVKLGIARPENTLAAFNQDETAPIYRTSVPNAELIKVSYNTFIGLKLAFANTLLEVCHKTDCDVDEVTRALKLAHRRLISGAYLDGGMGDGGGCHPRDNIALSWLARELDLSYDLFDATMRQRERQADWLADLMCEYDLPKGILGTAYKPGSHIVTGSPAMLVRNIMENRGHSVWLYDDHVHRARFSADSEPLADRLPHDPRVWLVGCKHPEFPDLQLPEGSVVIDPWRYIPDQPGVEVIRLGEGRPRFAKGGFVGGDSVPVLVGPDDGPILNRQQLRALEDG